MSRLLCVLTFALITFFGSRNSVAGDSEILFAVDREFSAMSQNDIADAFNRFLASDAQRLGEGYFGYERKNIIDWYRKNISQLKLRWWPIGAVMADSEDLGYTWGRYIERTSQDDGSVEEIHGKYLTIWEKDHNGEWKCVVNMAAMNPSPEK